MSQCGGKRKRKCVSPQSRDQTTVGLSVGVEEARVPLSFFIVLVVWWGVICGRRGRRCSGPAELWRQKKNSRPLGALLQIPEDCSTEKTVAYSSTDHLVTTHALHEAVSVITAILATATLCPQYGKRSLFGHPVWIARYVSIIAAYQAPLPARPSDTL